MINDRIADSVFQQVLMRADEYSVLATSNLNGDYLSDACAAQVGGLGMAPGSNIGDGFGVFEATHGTAPKYADKDVINPSSVMLSGAMMFEFLGWKEAAQLIEDGIARTIQQKKVTYDLERLMPGATKVGTSAFATAIIENMKGQAVAGRRRKEAVRPKAAAQQECNDGITQISNHNTEDEGTNEQKKSDGSGRRVCGIDDGAADCGSGAGRCGADGYSGWTAGRQGAGHGGVWADYADGFVRAREFRRRSGDYSATRRAATSW